MSDDASRSSNIVGPVDPGWTVVTLKIYVDTLTEVSNREHVAIRDTVDRLIEDIKEQSALVRSHYDTLLVEYDRRYQARFLASEQAVKDAFAAQEKAINAALAAASAAVNKADIANEKRFDNVNEFRAQLGDQQRTFMPRAEVEVLVRGINETLASVMQQLGAMVQRGEHDAGIRSLTDKFDSVVKRLDAADNRGRGGHETWAYLVAGAGVLIGIAGLALAILR